MLKAVTTQPHIGDVAHDLKSYVAARAIGVGIEPNWLNTQALKRSPNPARMVVVTMGNDENAIAHYLISISVLVPTYCAATAAGAGRRRWNSKGFAEDDGTLFITTLRNSNFLNYYTI
jgi:hypothetical protein